MPPNQHIDLPTGEQRVEQLARVLQIMTRSAIGQANHGVPNSWTADTNTGWANTLGSADATNGRGAKLQSQNLTYRMEVENSGMTIFGAPTLDAFTQGSVLFVGVNKVLSQDNTNLFWTDSTDTLKAQNLVVPTKAAIGAAALGSEVLTVTGNAQVSTFLGVGGAPSATIQLLVTGTANITGNFTVATNKLVVTAATGNIANGTTVFTTDVPNVKVSVGAATASTDAMFNVMGVIRSTSDTGYQTAGSGVSMYYIAGSNFGVIQCLTDGAGTYRDLGIYGLSIDLAPSSTSKFKVDGTGIGFYAHATAAKGTVTGSRAGNAALASLLTKLDAIGLITDSSS